jgi:hypothetical protein
MEKVVIISAIVSSISTLGIFFLTIVNYILSKKTEQRFSDLLEAIVVSNLTYGAGGAVTSSINEFHKYYTGKTEILPK